jgi:hypothetical protein
VKIKKDGAKHTPDYWFFLSEFPLFLLSLFLLFLVLSWDGWVDVGCCEVELGWFDVIVLDGLVPWVDVVLVLPPPPLVVPAVLFVPVEAVPVLFVPVAPPVNSWVVGTEADNVRVGVVGLDISTLTGVNAVCVGFKTNCWQVVPPFEATDAQIWAFLNL